MSVPAQATDTSVSAITARLRAAAGAAYAEHQRDVERIVEQVRVRAAAKQPVHIDKGGVHHVVPIPGDRRFTGSRIDISSLRRILHVDVAERLALIEPGVTFADLVRHTLPLGLCPMLVPELEGITVGGAVAGCSVESMSHKLGGFHDGCLEYEVITGDAELLRCSRETEPLAFEMVHGSYGTLATLTALVCRLVPAKAHVRMTYETYPDATAYLAAMRRHSDGGTTFIDGIIHGPNQFVLCLAEFVDHAPYVSSYRGAEIFWPSTATRKEDFLTTFDYFFRYDTECHWMTRTIPPLTWKPVRRLVGRWFLGSTNLITWSGRLAKILAFKKRPDVVVDVFIPSRRFVDFADWYAADYKFWPMWVVPYRMMTGRYPWLNPTHWARMNDDLMIDCAVYGKPNSDPAVDQSQVLEEATFRFDGIKTLISRNHYSKDRFWSIYDKDNVAAAKRRLDPHGLFPDLYDKAHRV